MTNLLSTCPFVAGQRNIMWRYTAEKPVVITRDILRTEGRELEDDPPYFTEEAIVYINEIYQPFLDRLTSIKTLEELATYVEELRTIDPEISPLRNRNIIWDLMAEKSTVLSQLLHYLLYDTEADELGISRSSSQITPWDVKEYIGYSNPIRRLLGLPIRRDDEEETPVLFPVTVTLDGSTTVLDIRPSVLVGVMAVYRYLHLMHPFSYKGHTFVDEMEIVNDMAFPKYFLDYKVNVGTDTFTFSNLEFFQGLLAGAQWNNLDPHTFITNLQKEEHPPQVVGFPFALPGGPLQEVTEHSKPIWKDLNY